MSTYYGTYGQKVQYLSSDPSPVQIGQVWYNSTSATLKVRATNATAVWTSGGTYPFALNWNAVAGSQTAGIAAGGYNPGPASTGSTAANTYNGTSWTAAPSLGAAIYYNSIMGTSTAALSANGTPPGPGTLASEKYNGSSWTSAGSLSQARSSGGRIGTSSAALMAGGFSAGANLIMDQVGLHPQLYLLEEQFIIVVGVHKQLQ